VILMHTEQRQRTYELLRARGLSRALFAHPHSITWLTGFAPAVQLGPNPFAGGPPLLWVEDGHFTLLIMDGLAGAAGALADEPDCDVVTYPGYTYQQPIDGFGGLRAALRQVASGAHGERKIGVEAQSLPMALGAILGESGWTEPMAIDGWLTGLRMVKTAEELVKLRANFALTDIGHAAARRAVRPGRREIDIWTEIHGAVERTAGHRVPLGNDCVVNTRQANIGGWPETHALGEQGSIIIDLSTLDQGYWSDSCATYYAGEPTAEQRAVHQVVADALDYATHLVRPGVKANVIDQKTRAFIADAGYPVYPHHTGHGVGVSGHEEPRITPYNEQPLKEGMVIMLEPGVYLPGESGVRLEDALLVTADGAEILTTHDKRLH
jgi:Xaa-Pro aminopeptidase